MIEINHLSKRYGTKLAVDDLTFTVRPGRVTGFLGPNGAGKSTTMRMHHSASTGPPPASHRQRPPLRRPPPRRYARSGPCWTRKAVHPGRTAHATTCCALAPTPGSAGAAWTRSSSSSG